MYQPFTVAVCARHLSGEITVGAYQLDVEGFGIWSLEDIDVLDRTFLDRLYQAAIGIGVPPQALLKEFSGSKGYHLWAFFAERSPGWKLRRLGEVILERSGLPIHDQRFLHPDGRPRELIEIYPKTTQLLATSKGMGQLVKLPLGIHRKTGNLAEPLDREGLGPVVQMPAGMLDSILAPFGASPPPEAAPRRKRSEAAERAATVERILRDPYPCTPGMMEDRWAEGGRNIACFALAKRWLVSGKTLEETIAIMTPWGANQCEPPMPADEVRETCVSAQNYTSMNCLSAEAAKHCVKTCPIWIKEHSPVLKVSNGHGPHLKVSSTTPVQYTLPLTDGEVILSADEILDWRKIRAAHAAQIPGAVMMLPHRAAKDWERELNELMLTKEVVDTPIVTAPAGVVAGFLQSWLGRASEDPGQVGRRTVWLDEEAKLFVFQGDAFIRHVQMTERGLDRKLIWRVVREHGGVERKREVPGEEDRMTVWEVPMSARKR